jgi:hypothetical protein
MSEWMEEHQCGECGNNFWVPDWGTELVSNDPSYCPFCGVEFECVIEIEIDPDDDVRPEGYEEGD